MKTRTLAVIGVGAALLAALPVAAQDKAARPPEPVRPPAEVKPPAELPPVEKTLPPDCEERCPAGIRVLWAERTVPCQTLIPRDVITFVKQRGVEVAYREEKRVVADFVLVPREVERPVTCTTTKEVKVTDPATGVCSTVTQPCTETRLVKETVYSAVRQERIEVVLVPYLRPVDLVVPRKDLLLEYRTEFRKEPVPVPIPEDVPGPRVFTVPPPPCDHDQ